MRFLCLIGLSLHLSTSALSSIFSDPVSSFDKGIAETATRVYAQMNERWAYPTDEAPCGSDSPFWITPEGCYLLCPNEIYMAQHASGASFDFCAAYDSLLALPARVECRIAAQMAKTMCVREILGDALFNTLARQIWNDATRLEERATFFAELSHTFWFPGEYRECRLVGRGFYVANLADYKSRYPYGSYQGHNLMGVGHNKMVGFGEIFKDGPVTRTKVLEDLHGAYGDETLTFDAFLERQARDQKAIPNNNKTCFLDKASVDHFMATSKVYDTLTTMQALFGPLPFMEFSDSDTDARAL